MLVLGMLRHYSQAHTGPGHISDMEGTTNTVKVQWCGRYLDHIVSVNQLQKHVDMLATHAR